MNYPNHSQSIVTPFTHFTIFKFWVCRLSSTRSFRPFQSKPSIGKGHGNIKQAQKSFRPHQKLMHCHTRTWLKHVIFKLLSPYLGIIRLRFVKQKCSPHWSKNVVLMKNDNTMHTSTPRVSSTCCLKKHGHGMHARYLGKINQKTKDHSPSMTLSELPKQKWSSPLRKIAKNTWHNCYHGLYDDPRLSRLTS